jgi:hypothetical protein
MAFGGFDQSVEKNRYDTVYRISECCNSKYPSWSIMDRFQTDTSLDGRIDLLSVSCHLFFLNAHNPSEESGGTSLGNPDYGNAG